MDRQFLDFVDKCFGRQQISRTLTFVDDQF